MRHALLLMVATLVAGCNSGLPAQPGPRDMEPEDGEVRLLASDMPGEFDGPLRGRQ